MIKLLLIACLIQIIPTFTQPSFAKKPHHHKHSPSQSQDNYSPNYVIGLNYTQQTSLIDLLRGNNQKDLVLSAAIRTEINNQTNSLPPGIKKRLAKGKSLPPGIAKKVELPKTVNHYLNISPDVKVIVVGSSVVVINSSNIILDILDSVF
jgi:hypothetical protein